MSSQRRINASKRNGARSRGPKTEAGKRRSSENALRHGLLAKRVVLQTESQDDFDIVLQQHVAKLKPRDGVELGIIEEMVACHWRLHRAIGIETLMLDNAVEGQYDGDDDERLRKSWTQINTGPGMQNVQRYQTMLHRMHRRALSNFLLLRDLDFDDADLRNEPSPISEHSDDAPPPTPLPPAAVAQPKPAQAGTTNPAPAQPLAIIRRAGRCLTSAISRSVTALRNAIAPPDRMRTPISRHQAEPCGFY